MWPFHCSIYKQTTDIARAKESWWLRVLTSQKWAKMSKNGGSTPESPGLAKKGPFFYNFSKVLENFRPKTRPFLRFFQFPGPPPRNFWKNGQKMHFGGSLGGPGVPICPWNGFFWSKWPKMTQNDPFWGFGGPLGPLFGGVLRPVSDPPFWGAKWPKNWPISHLLVLDFGQFYLHSSLKMSSFLAKIPEIWLPQTQKSVILFPITQQFFFIIGQNPEQTHVCIYI